MQSFRTRTHGLHFIILLVISSTVIAGEYSTPEQDRARQGPGDLVPRPDPSLLTTQQLLREIDNLRAIITTRLEASDKAITLLREQSDKIPGYTDTKLLALHNLLSERFKGMELQFEGVQLQFKERDERQNISAKATETAINAALQAQKESVAAANTSFAEATRKAEVGTKERLDQLTTLFQTETRALSGQLAAINKALDDKIVTLNARLGLIEGSGVGLASARGASDTSNQLIISVIGVLLVIIGLAVTIIFALRPHPPPANGNSGGNR